MPIEVTTQSSPGAEAAAGPGVTPSFDELGGMTGKCNKTCLKRPLKKKTRNWFSRLIALNAGQKYCSILHYFRPTLSYHLSLRPLFCLFLSGRLRQVLLYLLETSGQIVTKVIMHSEVFHGICHSWWSLTTLKFNF